MRQAESLVPVARRATAPVSPMARRIGLIVFATAATVALAATVIGALPPAATTPTAAVSAPAMARLPLYVSASGEAWFTMPVPAGWSVAQKPEETRGRSGGVRAGLIANVPIDQFITGAAYPEHLAWASLPRDAIVIEMRDVCGGTFCVAAASETTFPLRWSDAEVLTAGGPGTPAALPATFDARQIRISYFAEGHVLITYVGDRASTQDRELADAVVAGIAPAPLPTSGVVHDAWLSLGAFGALAADEPVFGTLPSQASLAPAGYYVIRHGTGVLAHPMLASTGVGQWCPLTWNATDATFSCPGRLEHWDRYGRALSANTADLEGFGTELKDGRAYLYFNSIGGGPIKLPGR
jgi:hypothetical protein